jgi:hypothetical protein
VLTTQTSFPEYGPFDVMNRWPPASSTVIARTCAMATVAQHSEHCDDEGSLTIADIHKIRSTLWQVRLLHFACNVRVDPVCNELWA